MPENIACYCSDLSRGLFKVSLAASQFFIFLFKAFIRGSFEDVEGLIRHFSRPKFTRFGPADAGLAYLLTVDSVVVLSITTREVSRLSVLSFSMTKPIISRFSRNAC